MKAVKPNAQTAVNVTVFSGKAMIQNYSIAMFLWYSAQWQMCQSHFKNG